MPEIHNIVAVGPVKLTAGPTEPDHAVRLIDLENRAVKQPVYITDITPIGDGIVGSKVFLPTTPANKFLQSAVTDIKTVRVHILVLGDMYVPSKVDVNGVDVDNYVAVTENIFSGSVDIEVEGTSDIIATNQSKGTTYTVNLRLAEEGPSVEQLVIGSLPGTQTEVKHNDIVPVTGIVENDAVSVNVKVSGAAKSGSIKNFGADDSAGQGLKTFSGTITVSNLSGELAVSVSALNDLGTEGEVTVSTNTITLNQTKPNIRTISINYVDGKKAMSNGDVASVSSTITEFDTVTYEFEDAGQEATIAEPNVYAATKQVTLVSGTYSVAQNYTITATRAANNATSTLKGTILIAETPLVAQIKIAGNPARLSTSESGVDYTVEVTANQTINSEPQLTLGEGVWAGNWELSNNKYTRLLSVNDSTPRGNLEITGTVNNMADITTETTATFTVGGLKPRTLTFAAYSRTAPIGSSVGLINKCKVRYSGTSSDLTLRNDTIDAPMSFTIVDVNGNYDANGTHLFLSDAAYAGSNTSGTLQVDFEELV